MKVRFPTKVVMKTMSKAATLTSKDLKICQRFKTMSNAAIDDIITREETKKIKESTKWARRVFESEFFVVKI